MTDATPAIDVFISADHDGDSRLYFARQSWCPPMLRDPLDENLEAFPVKPLDLDDLERHMWSCDAPYEKRVTTKGGVEVRAKGRSAVVLAVWLEGLLYADRKGLESPAGIISTP